MRRRRNRRTIRVIGSRQGRRRMTIIWLLRIGNMDIVFTNVLDINMAILLVFWLSYNIEVN